uniref:Globin domain-containing protein n=1 Tax=Xiphophorus couchianus TaxID=32473 RepID=A0A3B5MDZ9_9TELE
MICCLTAKDKDTVEAFWGKISPKAAAIGADAVHRMLVDLNPGSAPVAKHGATVMGGVAEAVAKIDSLTTGLLNLSELHAFTLRVDPAIFKVLAHNILLVLAISFPNDFTLEVHVAMDKFLSALALALSKKYR